MKADQRLVEPRIPEIFTTDHGSQFTRDDFTDRLDKTEALISMDCHGRCFDNILMERLRRSVKYEGCTCVTTPTSMKRGPAVTVLRFLQS